MNDPMHSFGGRLYMELRRLSGFDVITDKLEYGPIQQLKQADREQTVALFQASSELLRHALRTAEPEDVARMMVEDFQREVKERQADSLWHALGSLPFLLIQ